MLGYYNYSVILTYMGLCSAVVGMVNALQKNPRRAILCLMFCGVCDMFDGTIARTCKRTEDEKSFGIQIDSLCDLVCFGVFPAILGYSIGITSWFGTSCMAFYVLAAVIRLGYFNVQEMNRVQNGDEKRNFYNGLPVTSVALLMPILLLLDIPSKFSIVRFYHIGLLLIGLAFLSKIKIRKLYFHGLLALSAVGLIVFFLIYRYGGLIACAKTPICFTVPRVAESFYFC